jgi:penicillin-binding protein 2
MRRCWQSGGHGFVNLHEAIRQSCDVYFYALGSELGIETIARYARIFGLGSSTGIALPGERAGIVPDSAWSLEVRNSPWYPGETVSVAIGQGPILTSPLQVAIMMAVAANGGRRVVPYLVEGEAQPAVDLGLDPAAIDTVREALRAVVNDRGTGATARLSGIEIAGKTATSQVIEQKTWTRNEDLPYEQRDHAWFASFGPYDAPELVVVAFVEHGGHGSRVAAPVARALYERYVELEQRQSDPP